MFKFKEHPVWLRATYALVFLMVMMRLGRTLLPSSIGSDLAFSFRSDNFFSFSGGQIRRGLIGEGLLQLQSIGVDAIVSYSLLLLLTYFLLYTFVFPKLLASFRVSEVLLILLSGFFLMPGIDRELFMLLPAVYYFARRKEDAGFYLLIALNAFIHELSLLLYFPFIWGLLRNLLSDRKWYQLLYLLVIAASFGSVILLKSELNLVPEREFWPLHGVSGLEEHFLYTFAGKGLLATLKLHGSVILGKVETLYAIPGLIAFFLLVMLSLRRFGAKAIVLYYYLAINVLLFLLTIDYGRYFYLLFFFYLLVAQSGLLLKAEQALASFKFLMPGFVEKLFHFDFSPSLYRWLLIVFAVAPFGYWLGDTMLEPAFWQEISQLIDFKVPKYAGE